MKKIIQKDKKNWYTPLTQKKIENKNSNYFFIFKITIHWPLIYSFSPEKVGNIIH